MRAILAPLALAFVAAPAIAGRSETDRIESTIRDLMRGDDFSDDFSLLVVEVE